MLFFFVLLARPNKCSHYLGLGPIIKTRAPVVILDRILDRILGTNERMNEVNASEITKS